MMRCGRSGDNSAWQAWEGAEQAVPSMPDLRLGLSAQMEVSEAMSERGHGGLPVRVGVVVSLFLTMVGLVAIGCNAPTIIVTPATPVPTATPVPPRGPITIVFCDDETGSYPRSLFKSAAAKMANWITPLFRANQSGVTVYVQWINKDSYTIDSTAMTIQIPAIGPQPADPSSLPTPQPFDANGAATATVASKGTATAFASIEQQYQTQFDQAQAQLARDTKALRNLRDGGINGSDIWGCPQRATERLRAAPAGAKYLVIASDMQIVGPQQHLDVELPGVKVFVINYKCGDVYACNSKTAFWTRGFRSAHAASVTFDDPGQTFVIDQLFK